MPRRIPRSRRARRAAALALLTGLLGAVLLPAAPAAAAGPAPADLVVDLTFPVEPGARYADDYTQPRSGGRTHCATDLLGPKHSDVYAAVGGTITFMPTTKPSYGYLINLQGVDGRKYSYVHLNDDTPGTNDDAAGPSHAYAPGLAVGSKVARGQLIGFLGDSGNAKGTDHLHFEVHDPAYDTPACATGGAGRINPYRSLREAQAQGDLGGGAPPAGQPAPAPDGGTSDTSAARTTEQACPPGRVPASGFEDVGPTHAPGVDCVRWWEVVAGTSPTRFSPTDTISRAQLATFVANLAAASGKPLPATVVDHFDDDDGSVHEDNVNRVATAGIMGSDSRTFWPDLAVSRGSMASVVHKTFAVRSGADLPPGPDAFSDDDTATNEAKIDAVAHAGIAAGFADGTFRPATSVTREQMATFFARLLDALVEGGDGTPPA